MIHLLMRKLKLILPAFFAAALLSLSAFGQKDDQKKPPPKGDPPVIKPEDKKPPRGNEPKGDDKPKKPIFEFADIIFRIETQDEDFQG